MKTNPKSGLTLNRLKPILILLVMAPLFASCGMHYNIKGKVVDAQTGEPVEGAVVAINWIRYKLAPPGYPTPKERYGTTEDLTDEQGGFIIPKYPIGTHFMGVYKDGYVCWSSETLFNQKGKDRDEMFIRRWEGVNNGMVVKLVPKAGEFPKLEHARFILNVGTALSSPKPKFNSVVEEERQLYINFIDERKRKDKK
jgi:hypothetical protein